MDLSFDYKPSGTQFPLHKQVEQHLRAQTRQSAWGPDDTLPSRQALARAFRVDLSTVQRAIARLLIGGLQGHPLPTQVRLQSRLILRDSTRREVPCAGGPGAPSLARSNV